jgi:ankyrin repeat protein
MMLMHRSRLVASTAWRSVTKATTASAAAAGAAVESTSSTSQPSAASASIRTYTSTSPSSMADPVHHHHYFPTLPNDNLDELCQKHMDVPAQEFAMGCSVLHQIALGIAVLDLENILNDMPSLVNFRDYDRRTPLHIAASEGHVELCLLLLQRGAKINRCDRWGGSPLDDAYRHRHSAVIELLKMRGGRFGSPSQANNLISAASEGDLEEVKALLEYGNVDLSIGDYGACVCVRASMCVCFLFLVSWRAMLTVLTLLT